MSELSPRDHALIGLGAALGSNCVPCVEHHVPLARQVGLSDAEIESAIALADKIRQVPAKRVLATAMQALATSVQSIEACSELDSKPSGQATRPVAAAVNQAAPARAPGGCC